MFDRDRFDDDDDDDWFDLEKNQQHLALLSPWCVCVDQQWE